MADKNNSIPKPGQLKWLDSIATLLDRAFKIPGTTLRIGLDPIIGLIPVVGDLVSFGISSVLLYAAFTNGASGKVIMKMLLNIALDASIGMIPVIGNIFDFAYKANTRNYKLLEEHWQEGKHMGSGWEYIAAGMFILVSFISVVILLVWKLIALMLAFLN